MIAPNIITGDLLRITHGTILHQVNCRGVLGGLAHSLHREHPAAFVDYLLTCDKYGAANAGSIVEGHASRHLSIIHVFGQLDPGPCTDMNMVQIALGGLINRPLLKPVYAPFMMGCGMGGGSWDAYIRALLTVLPDIHIVQRPTDVVAPRA